MTLSFSGRNPSGSFILLGHQLCIYWVYNREQNRQKSSSFLECVGTDNKHTEESITGCIMRLENKWSSVWSGMPVGVVVIFKRVVRVELTEVPLSRDT